MNNYTDLPKTSTFEGIHTVFVYGTLKEGFHNNRLLTDAEKVDEGHTVQKYDMHFSGGLPYVLESGDTSKIHGEVYLVNNDTFARLDQLEGHPDFYERRITWIQPKLGAPRKAWVYFYNENGPTGYGQSFNRGTLVESGTHTH